MEEWRPVPVDSIVMALINGHEIHKDDFVFEEESGTCLLTKTEVRKYLSRRLYARL